VVDEEDEKKDEEDDDSNPKDKNWEILSEEILGVQNRSETIDDSWN
jgi:hypothetical protein